MHRFFVPADAIRETEVRFPEETAHQLARVLRMRPGDHVIVLDNSGWEREVVLEQVGRRSATGRVVGKRLAEGEPRVKITLYQAMLKGAKFEMVLQKGTELGVVSFVPVITSRTVVGSLGNVGENRLNRWQRIITEAAEQSRRGRLPALEDALMFEHAVSQAYRRGGRIIMPYEGESSLTLREALAPNEEGERPFSISLFIGPEGGFEEEEVQLARQAGAAVVTLGKRILRAETAAIAATTAILYELGEWE